MCTRRSLSGTVNDAMQVCLPWDVGRYVWEIANGRVRLPKNG